MRGWQRRHCSRTSGTAGASSPRASPTTAERCGQARRVGISAQQLPLQSLHGEARSVGRGDAHKSQKGGSRSVGPSPRVFRHKACMRAQTGKQATTLALPVRRCAPPQTGGPFCCAWTPAGPCGVRERRWPRRWPWNACAQRASRSVTAMCLRSRARLRCVGGGPGFGGAFACIHVLACCCVVSVHGVSETS